MNEDVIADLKQFIAVTIKNELVETERRLEQKLEEKLAAQTAEILAAVADTFPPHNEHVDAVLDDHERRITKLEHHHA